MSLCPRSTSSIAGTTTQIYDRRRRSASESALHDVPIKLRFKRMRLLLVVIGIAVGFAGALALAGFTRRETITKRARKAATTTVKAHQDQVARLAYYYWEERGRPEGSPEVDWHRAEEELRRRHSS